MFYLFEFELKKYILGLNLPFLTMATRMTGTIYAHSGRSKFDGRLHHRMRIGKFRFEKIC